MTNAPRELARPSDLFARQIRHWRTERRLSTQDLADRLVEIGVTKLNRRVISKIESGERGVSLDEWLQLAHALAVPPPLLLVDLQSGERIEVAPKVSLHPWIVWGWIAGEHASPVMSERGGAVVSRVEEFARSNAVIWLYKQEEASSNAVSRNAADIRAAEYTGDPERLRIAKSDHVDNLRILAQTLDSMIEVGMTPPAKPADVVEAIRALELSKYPDRLAVSGPPADPDEVLNDGLSRTMRRVTDADGDAWEAAKARRAREQKDD